MLHSGYDIIVLWYHSFVISHCVWYHKYTTILSQKSSCETLQTENCKPCKTPLFFEIVWILWNNSKFAKSIFLSHANVYSQNLKNMNCKILSNLWNLELQNIVNFWLNLWRIAKLVFVRSVTSSFVVLLSHHL